MTTTEITLRLIAAMVAGSLLGLNRTLHEKPLGVRTLGLVCLGSALVVLAAVHVAAGSSIAPVIQGVVTGIGFLGAGVIMRHESDQNIQGLTTAACTWLTACIGIACAVAPPFMALVGLLLAYVLLALGGKFEKAVHGYFYPKKPNTTDKP